VKLTGAVAADAVGFALGVATAIDAAGLAPTVAATLAGVDDGLPLDPEHADTATSVTKDKTRLLDTTRPPW